MVGSLENWKEMLGTLLAQKYVGQQILGPKKFGSNKIGQNLVSNS